MMKGKSNNAPIVPVFKPPTPSGTNTMPSGHSTGSGPVRGQHHSWLLYFKEIKNFNFINHTYIRVCLSILIKLIQLHVISDYPAKYKLGSASDTREG